MKGVAYLNLILNLEKIVSWTEEGNSIGVDELDICDMLNYNIAKDYRLNIPADNYLDNFKSCEKNKSSTKYRQEIYFNKRIIYATTDFEISEI